MKNNEKKDIRNACLIIIGILIGFALLAVYRDYHQQKANEELDRLVEEGREAREEIMFYSAPSQTPSE